MTSTGQLMEEGKTYLNKFQFVPAEHSFQQALNQDPHSAEARVGLARIQLLKEQTEEGVRFLNEALEIQPSNAEALALKGISFMQKKDWKSAVTFLEKAREADPKLELIYVNLAKGHRELGHPAEAVESARKAVKLNPENYQAHSELGHALVMMKKVKAGIKEMNAAIRINPLFIQGYVVLGHFYAAAGKVDVAIQVCRKGLRLNPIAIILREMLAGFFAVKGDFQRAYLERIYIALTRNDDRDWLAVGNLAVATGKFERAEEAYQKALQVNSGGWEGHFNLGELYLAARLNDKAKEQYRLAIEKDGKSFKPYNAMGLYLLDIENNKEEAKKYFIRALEIAPNQKEPMLNLAITYAELREKVAAENLAHATLQAAKKGDGIYEQAEKLLKEI